MILIHAYHTHFIIDNDSLKESKALKYTRLPVTRWVKLSLNFELLVLK